MPSECRIHFWTSCINCCLHLCARTPVCGPPLRRSSCVGTTSNTEHKRIVAMGLLDDVKMVCAGLAALSAAAAAFRAALRTSALVQPVLPSRVPITSHPCVMLSAPSVQAFGRNPSQPAIPRGGAPGAPTPTTAPSYPTPTSAPSYSTSAPVYSAPRSGPVLRARARTLGQRRNSCVFLGTWVRCGARMCSVHPRESRRCILWCRAALCRLALLGAAPLSTPLLLCMYIP